MGIPWGQKGCIARATGAANAILASISGSTNRPLNGQPPPDPVAADGVIGIHPTFFFPQEILRSPSDFWQRENVSLEYACQGQATFGVTAARGDA